jgi:putative oxidoreductase
LGPLAGVVEIVCGTLIFIGLATPALSHSDDDHHGVALFATKAPILLGHDFWIFHVPELNRYGFWSMQHESRTDFALLFGCLYLLIEGAGRWSIDALASVRPPFSNPTCPKP